ncbi:polysaccharide lyase family 8 super-sandwich domain-containing protein [Helicobacter heilmannii]|uniref:Hyaluronate lyase n=1 Tax=Helicobacter heilmannii TaxID=35817 RepID=A0A0K2Y5A5_HELHE|nr:polysaccharide lyase family 8 super-sandwich domain-containing protein [Helicobacter heilmannii]CCM12033.1 Hyaluronate lyase precursor [Helicobacter heilmannii ASB1.4]CRI34336.1 Hyaluronate lyase precursor [Helicobacter heilmannii]
MKLIPFLLCLSLLQAVPLDFAKLRANYTHTLLEDNAPMKAEHLQSLPFEPSGKELLRQLRTILGLLKAHALNNAPLNKAEIIKALQDFSQYYGVGGLERGNWWPYEIGIPKALNAILALAHFLPKSLQTTLLQAQEYYQPNPKYSGLSAGARASTNPESRESKGANRVDTAFISLARGILKHNEKEVLQAIEAVKSASKIVASGNGFYADGSFIQHEHVPSNGSYGLVLLKGLAQFKATLAHTPLTKQRLIDPALYASVLKGYPYLLIQGGINASVCGRGISRDQESDFTRGQILLKALQGFNNPALAALIKGDTSHIPPVHVFGAMDRAAQVGAHGGRVVLAMHSSRIVDYETINGENLKGFDTSDGMTYIYGSPRAFVDFWPLVDFTKLPGTTEVQNQEVVVWRRGSLGLNDFAGGASDGRFGFVGLDLQKPEFRAQKSYLFLGDEVVALGSIVGDKPTTTILDNRKLSPDTQVFINNAPFSQQATLAHKGDFINFTNPSTHTNIGYILLEDENTKLQEVARSGNYKAIGGKSYKTLSAPFLEMQILHPLKARYAYVILPNFSPKDVQNYSLEDFKILSQTPALHAVFIASKRLLAINKYAPGWQKLQDLKLKDPLSLLQVQRPSGLTLNIADPTQTLQKTTIILKGHYKLAAPNTKVLLKIKGNSTHLTLTLPPLGATLAVDLATL